MSSGEKPIGAAKGKQSDTEALCQAPPPQGVALIFISAGGWTPLDPLPPSPLALNHVGIRVLGTFFHLGQFFPPVPSAHP